ncbi:conserved hypothetical protein [Paraburkholderia caribensis]|nr:conserved hypothetical protein [Paraburkholderia caribensis]
MKVSELIAKLQAAPPSARVLFLAEYADVSESDEIWTIEIPLEPWTFERGVAYGGAYELCYPGLAAERGAEYSKVVVSAERVVVLSSGPTNFKYWPGDLK